ncbi:hypothetical protein O9993_16690 [Vibrio lentus]|nr:hypothetical protein [Vibrio lentus]
MTQVRTATESGAESNKSLNDIVSLFTLARRSFLLGSGRCKPSFNCGISKVVARFDAAEGTADSVDVVTNL